MTHSAMASLAVVFVALCSFLALPGGEATDGRIETAEGGPLLDGHVHIEWVPIVSRRNASELMRDAFQEVVEDDEEESPQKIHRIGDMLNKSYDTIKKEENEGKSRLESLAAQQIANVDKSATVFSRILPCSSLIVSLLTVLP